MHQERSSTLINFQPICVCEVDFSSYCRHIDIVSFISIDLFVVAFLVTKDLEKKTEINIK